VLSPHVAPYAEDLAPWRSPLARALHRNRSQPFARYFQLATVRADGSPANRTVVFRGFLAQTNLQTNLLMIISDRRSEKITQLQQNPQAEICWYFTQTREQFRLSGQLMAIGAEAAGVDAAWSQARIDLWRNLSDNARSQFYWPQPKAPRVAEAVEGQLNSEDSNAKDFDVTNCDAQHPPASFDVLFFGAHSVDHLVLRGNPQSRQLYHRVSAPVANSASDPAQLLNNAWQIIPVNP
jgi:pyridoxamine 5'-phosphate oxidase